MTFFLLKVVRLEIVLVAPFEAALEAPEGSVVLFVVSEVGVEGFEDWMEAVETVLRSR